ncbi:hypothetical protein EYC59_05560 [Candidatus Saccharibacteria bacterium]|nr:MAG: hypothetical protein EYC59_05560 [Candidatus Saccharibacteria bacterium]
MSETTVNQRAWQDIELIQYSVRDAERRRLVPMPELPEGFDPNKETVVFGPSAWRVKEGHAFKERFSLLWLVDTRVVLEDFYPTETPDGKEWFRTIADIDIFEGDVKVIHENERGGFERSFNASDPGLDSNDRVLIGQASRRLAELTRGVVTGEAERLEFPELP